MKTVTVKLDPKHPDLKQISILASQLAQGGIVAFPTETVYGLGVCANQPQAVQRLKALKGRSQEKPFSYHIGHLGTLERLDIIQSHAFRFLADEFWPGPVTLLALNRREEKIGIRYPKNLIATELINATGELILATSANRAGDKSPHSISEVLKTFPDQLDGVIDGGECELGEDSTIVDAAVFPPAVVRRGADAGRVDEAIERIRRGQYPKKRILIVCTGNTCRSPMAEAWLKSELARSGWSEQISVRSCGIYTRDGQAASVDAVLALKNDEIEMNDFRTHQCRREDVLAADMILVMGDEHRRFIADLCQEAKDRIVVLHVADPIGMTIDFYQKSYQTIKDKIKNIWRDIIKLH